MLTLSLNLRNGDGERNTAPALNPQTLKPQNPKAGLNSQALVLAPFSTGDVGGALAAGRFDSHPFAAGPVVGLARREAFQYQGSAGRAPVKGSLVAAWRRVVDSYD